MNYSYFHKERATEYAHFRLSHYIFMWTTKKKTCIIFQYMSQISNLLSYRLIESTAKWHGAGPLHIFMASLHSRNTICWKEVCIICIHQMCWMQCNCILYISLFLHQIGWPRGVADANEDECLRNKISFSIITKQFFVALQQGEKNGALEICFEALSLVLY